MDDLGKEKKSAKKILVPVTNGLYPSSDPAPLKATPIGGKNKKDQSLAGRR